MLKYVDIPKNSADDSSVRPSGNVDRWSTTRTTNVDSQSRKSVAEDMTTSGTDEFDVYTIETALPHVEWEKIEESLRMSAGEQNKRWVSWASIVQNYTSSALSLRTFRRRLKTYLFRCSYNTD